jgi:hypothetical protein
MAPQNFYRCWDVYLRGERIGQVLAATEKAACLRAIHKFGISREAQQDLQVRPSPADDRQAQPRV